jgi:Ser/Thr protein kinase RdoA (MazF antagonist)
MTDVLEPLSFAEHEALSMLADGPACPVGLPAAMELIEQHYSTIGDVSLLTGERDENFRMESTEGDGTIFKIFGPSQADAAADMLAKILIYLERTAPDLPVPRLIVGRSGEILRFQDEMGRDRCAVMYSFLPGRPLMDTQRNTQQYRQCGTLLATLAQALSGFRHSAMRRPLIWNLCTVPALRGLLPQIRDLPFETFICKFLERFMRDVADPLSALPHQFVHNDFNARNIIVAAEDEAWVKGVIDFGDAIYTARVADGAVGVIGQLSTPDCAECALKTFVEAYEAVSPLEATEKALLPWMVAARIVQNVVVTSWYRGRQLSDEHFAGFDEDYFAWRVDFARSLITESPISV